jgi:hypothetical protein
MEYVFRVNGTTAIPEDFGKDLSARVVTFVVSSR